MGSRTTYYSLAKDRLKGNHPRIYNLILMLTLMSLTGTAAFLISDIFSFGIDYDNMSIQGGKGIIFPALWGDKKASSGATDDGGQENALSALDANASPDKAMSSQSTSNSTGKDENGNASRELDSSQTSSATGQATGSIASAKKTSSSTSSKKSHSSSGSSSSSRSKSSSEKEEKAAVPDNESANATATNQTSINHLPENRSDTLSTQKDNATAKEQSNKPTAGVYRNESPQSLIDHDAGDDPASGSKSLNSETAAAGTTDGMEILPDDEGSAKGNERQESRSVKRDELAKDRAERNEKVANERALSSKRGQRQSRIAGT